MHLRPYVQICSKIASNPFKLIFRSPLKASLISNTVRNKLQRSIPNAKRTRSYPAVLIGRIGVACDLRGYNIGSQIVEYIKMWFVSHNNKSGCRYIVVDAYNSPKVLSFYEKNDFKYLYSTEEEEKATFGLSDGEHLNSRMMYFDLIGYSAYVNERRLYQVK